MLELKIKNKVAPLSKDTSITVVANNPIFDKDSVGRAYSLPFRLPLTPALRSTIHYKDRFDAKNEVDTYDSMLTIDGQMVSEGSIVLGEDSKTDMYALDVHYQNNQRDLLDELEQIKVNPLLGTLDIPQALGGFWDFRVTPPVSHPTTYRIRINDNDVDVYSESGDTGMSIVNKMVAGIEAIAPGIATAVLNPGGSALLGTQLRILVEVNDDRMVKFEPWAGNLTNFTLQAGHRTYSDARITNFTDFIKDLRDTPRADISFPTVQVGSFYGARNLSIWRRTFNHVYLDGATVEVSTNTPSETEEWNWSYMPFLKMSYVLEKIRAASGLTAIVGELDEWSDIEDSLIYSNTAIDDVAQTWYFDVLDTSATLMYVNRMKASIALGELMPEYNAKQFLSDFAMTFNLTFEKKDNKLIFKKKNTPLSKPAKDWTKVSVRNHEKRFKAAQDFTINYVRDENDLAEDTGSILTNYGTGKQVFALPFSTITTYEIFILADELSFTFGFCDQQGTTTAYAIGKKTQKLRLVHENVETDTATGRAFWVATPRATLQDGTVVRTFSYKLNGALGMYEVFWKGYAELVANGSELVKYFLLDVSQMQEILRWINPNRYFEDARGRFEGVIKSIEFTATNQRGKLLTKVIFVNKLNI